MKKLMKPYIFVPILFVIILFTLLGKFSTKSRFVDIGYIDNMVYHNEYFELEVHISPNWSIREADMKKLSLSFN